MIRSRAEIEKEIQDAITRGEISFGNWNDFDTVEVGSPVTYLKFPFNKKLDMTTTQNIQVNNGWEANLTENNTARNRAAVIRGLMSMAHGGRSGVDSVARLAYYDVQTKEPVGSEKIQSIRIRPQEFIQAFPEFTEDETLIDVLHSVVMDGRTYTITDEIEQPKNSDNEKSTEEIPGT